MTINGQKTIFESERQMKRVQLTGSLLYFVTDATVSYFVVDISDIVTAYKFLIIRLIVYLVVRYLQ